MPFCPKCRFEYNKDVKKCPDCSVKLVARLKEIPDIRFVALPNLPGKVYAEMIREVLRQKGIPCYLRSSGIIDAYGISGMPVGDSVRIFVPEDRLEECKDIQHNMLDHI